MRRKMLDQLIAWKKNGAGKTALLIDGARRVGKSYCVEQFARQIPQLYYPFWGVQPDGLKSRPQVV